MVLNIEQLPLGDADRNTFHGTNHSQHMLINSRTLLRLSGSLLLDLSIIARCRKGRAFGAGARPNAVRIFARRACITQAIWTAEGKLLVQQQKENNKLCVVGLQLSSAIIQSLDIDYFVLRITPGNSFLRAFGSKHRSHIGYRQKRPRTCCQQSNRNHTCTPCSPVR
jgi:hypothetical protein